MEPQKQEATKTLRRRHPVLWFIAGLLSILIVGILAAGIYFFSTDSGTRYFIDLVNASQNKIHFKYVKGSLLTGLVVDDIVIDPSPRVQITADGAEIKIGWKALGRRHLHLRLVAVDDVVIRQLQPSDNKPFVFKDIRSPLSLDIDTLTVNQLEFIPYQKSSGPVFKNIDVADLRFIDDTLSLANATFDQSALRLNHAAGYIRFREQYPLQFDVNFTLPHLARYGLEPVQVYAGGTLADVRAGGETKWPQPIYIKFEASPVASSVPFNVLLGWQDISWGFVPPKYKASSKAGYFMVKGTKSGADARLLTDFDSTVTRKAALATVLSTNYSELDINSLLGKIFGGSIKASGEFGFKSPYAFKLSGKMSGIKSADLPEAIQEILPSSLDGKFSLAAQIPQKDRYRVGIYALLSGNEELEAGVGLLAHSKKLPEKDILENEEKTGLAPASEKVAYEAGVVANWKNIATSIKQIGNFTLTSGSLKGQLKADSGSIMAKTNLSSQGQLPTGYYQGALGYGIRNGVTALALKDLMYKGSIGKATAGGEVKYQPKMTNYLLWKMKTDVESLNVNAILPRLPVKSLSGTFNSTGEQNSARHNVTLKNLDLTATIQESGSQKTQKAYLTGTAQAVALFGKPLTFSKQTPAVPTPKEVLTAQVDSADAIRAFGLNFNGNLSASPGAKGKTELKLAGTKNYLDLKKFYHDGIAGLVDATGKIYIDNGPSWHLKARFDHLNPGVALSDWPGSLTGTADTSGTWQNNSKKIDIRQLNVNGELRHEPVQARGRLLLVFPTTEKKGEKLRPTEFDADHFFVSMAGNSVGANGNTRRLYLDINAPNLSKIHPSISGQIQGKAIVSGNTSEPDINADIRAKNLKYHEYALEKGEAHVDLPRLGKLPGQVKIALSNLFLSKSQIQGLLATYSGQLSAHVLTARITDRKTVLDLAAKGSLNSSHTVWSGVVNRGQIVHNDGELKLVQPASVVLDQKASSVRVSPHCWSGMINLAGVNPVTPKMLATESSKTIEKNAQAYTFPAPASLRSSRWCVLSPLEVSKSKGDVNVGVENLDMRAITMFLPKGVTWKGLLNGTMKMDWIKGQKPALVANFVTQKGEITVPGDEYGEDPISMPYDILKLAADTRKEGLHVRFDGKTPSIGRGYVDAIINPDVSPKTINGALVLDDVQVSVLKPFFPQFRTLSGTASWAGGMSGPLSGPDFYGEFNLVNGRLALANDPIQLSNIKLHSSIRGTQATIDGQFNSGSGLGRLDGTANWQTTPKILLRLTGSELAIRQAPLYTFFVTPDLNFDIRPKDKYFNLTGTIQVPNGRITPQIQNEKDVITISPDVRVTDRRLQAEAAKPGALTGVKIDRTRQVDAVKAWSINTGINLVLGKNVRVTGFGTDVPLTGALQLKQAGQGRLQAVGEIGTLRPARIEAYGQNMLLEHARVNFGGPVKDGAIDGQASKVIDNRNFGIRVTGTVSKPKISFYNDAGLSEQETISAILTGHTSDMKLSPDSSPKDEMAANLALIGLGYGLDSSNRIANKIGRRFGVEGFALGAEGAGSSTRVNLSGYITPDLYIRYGVGVFSPVNKLTVRYQVTQRLYLEATSSLEKAIDLFYNWRF